MKKLLVFPVIAPDKNKLSEGYEVARDFEAAYKKVKIFVPKFFQFDGASIPSAAWHIIGTPFNPKFMKAAVVHDWLYHTHQLKRKDADELLYRMLRKNNVGKVKAKAMKKVVRGFGGWYWKNDKDDVVYLDDLRKKIRTDGRDPSRYGL